MGEKFENQLRELFRRFYIAILRDPYMATFVRSYAMINRLVERQSRLLQSALLGEKSEEEVYQAYFKATKVHWNLRIHEKAMFDMIEFLREALLQQRERWPEEVQARILPTMKRIREACAEAYIQGILEDALTVLGSREDIILDDHILWLEAFYRALFQKGAPPEFDPGTCKLGRWLKSLTFEVMCHRSSDLQVKILTTHKELHESARMAYHLYHQGHKEEALPLIRMVSEDIFLLNSFLNELFLRWESGKLDILLDYIREKSFQGELFIIAVNRALLYASGLKETLLRFQKELSHQAQEIFGLAEEACLVENEGHFYLLVDTVRFSFEKIQTFLERAAEELAHRFPRIQKPLICTALVRPEDLRPFNTSELRELVAEIEAWLLKQEEKAPLVVKDVTPLLPSFMEKVRERLRLKRLLWQAIDKRSFHLFLQPIYLLDTRSPTGWFEVLARVRDEAGQMISPGQFLPLVQQEGWQEIFDQAVLETIEKRLAELSQVAQRLFINLHPSSLASESVLEAIKSLAQKAAGHQLKLVLEVTEYENLTQLDFMDILEKGLVELAVDDFGAGYANFELVGRLAQEGVISFVKVDGYLVKEAVESPAIYAVVEAVVTLALDLKLGVIFEFIEGEAIIEMLKAIPRRLREKFIRDSEKEGDFFGQGYFYAPPKPLEDWLSKGSR